MLINKYLPNFHFNEYHSKEINGTREEILAAINSLQISEISIVVNYLLFFRSLTLKKKKKRNFDRNTLLLEKMQNSNFYILEQSDSEIVIGLIGQFWNLRDINEIKIESTDEYLNFNNGNYGIVATNFFIEEKEGISILSTETRIKIGDPSSRRKFAIYWFFIYLGSSLTRKILLNAIKKKVENYSRSE